MNNVYFLFCSLALESVLSEAISAVLVAGYLPFEYEGTTGMQRTIQLRVRGTQLNKGSNVITKCPYLRTVEWILDGTTGKQRTTVLASLLLWLQHHFISSDKGEDLPVCLPVCSSIPPVNLSVCCRYPRTKSIWNRCIACHCCIGWKLTH